MDTSEDLLQQIQDDLEQTADEMDFSSGIDRRNFVFLSLAAAAATTFGVTRASAQGGRAGGAAGGAQQTPPPLPLGNGEPPAMQFQAYPGGTGALMEKIAKERGRAAFERSTFTVAPWSGAVPASDDDIAFLPAHRLSALLRERRITAVRLTDIYLNRIKRLDPVLLCAVTIMEDQARAEAVRADAEIRGGRYRGPLHGLPYGIKDLFSTKGVRTTWGSEEFEHRIIDEDAEMVVRLREAGAVLIAKLATGRFASGDQWYRGRTNNPWDIRRGSSGSSAGPGSATAAGCVAFSLGTETSGSIVSPSRECGLSALRPTFGRVSRYGAMTLAWSRDRVGPMCRTIEDCAMVFNVIHGVDEKDPSTLMAPFEFDRNIRLSSLRIGADTGAPPEFVAGLRALGATITPIGPRPQMAGGGGGGGGESTAAFDSYVQAKARELGIDLATLETAGGRGGGRGRGGLADSTAGEGRGDAPPNPAAAIRFPGANGRGARALDFVQGLRRRQILITQMAEHLKDFDMYIPASGGADIALHAQTGHPCAVVPYKFEPQPAGRGGGGGRGRGGGADSTAAGGVAGAGGRGGAPGEQVVYNPQPICAVLAGNLFTDDRVLSVAHAYQMSTDWHTRRPNI